MNYTFLNTMYERDFRTHTVVTSHGAGKVTCYVSWSWQGHMLRLMELARSHVTSHGAGKVTYRENLLSKNVNNIFLPEIRRKSVR